MRGIVEGVDSFKDPRIFENPIEASIELADITSHRLPSLQRRNDQMRRFAAIWTSMVIVLTLLVGLLFLSLVISDSWDIYSMILVISLGVLFVPSIGLGISLLVLSYQEKMFLPYLEQSSKAMVALGGPPVGVADAEKGAGKKEQDEEAASPGGSIGGILGSAMWVGDMVPVAGRLTAIARGVVAVIILGLGYLIAIAIVGLLTELFMLNAVVAEIIVFAIFVGPALLIFQSLSHDMDFYKFYQRRHSALGEIAALGIPPVPKGDDHLDRFDRFLKTLPYVDEMLRHDGGVEEHPGKGGYEFSRLYHGMLAKVRTGILVKRFDHVPTRDEIDTLLKEARAFGKARTVALSRVVALVATDVDDLDDKVYDHVVEIGRRTAPDDCALQLVMEVEGTYSMVPYVSM